MCKFTQTDVKDGEFRMNPAYNHDRLEGCKFISLLHIGTMPWKAVAALLLVLCLCDSSRTEDLNLTQRFLLLSTLRISTLEREVRAATGSGYRLLFASSAGSGSEVGGGLPQAFTERNQLILEKTSSGPESIDYLFLKSRGQSPADSAAFLESDMNEAVARGYRFVPRTVLGLMEKRATDNSSPSLRYRILAGSSKHLQEEICKASSAGFQFLDLVDNVVVMEKSSVSSETAGNTANTQTGRGAGCLYLVIGTRTEGALRKEIAAGAANGYRVVSASCPGEIMVVMEKAADSGSREYLILDSMRVGKLERDIKEGAGRGFHAVPRAFIAYSITNVAILEKMTAMYEYTLLQAQKSATLQKKLSNAAEQGFRPVAMNGSRIMLLEKTRP